MAGGTCEDCGSYIIETQAPGVGKRVEGWVLNRKGGGANQLISMSEPRGFSCKSCMALRRAGIHVHQPSLF